jgi:hypothetical protein
MPVEVAFDLHPGQVFKGTVEGVWPNGQGQYLPSGTLPTFTPPPPQVPQARIVSSACSLRSGTSAIRTTS